MADEAKVVDPLAESFQQQVRAGAIAQVRQLRDDAQKLEELAAYWRKRANALVYEYGLER